MVRDLDLAIFTARAVADHEVVTAAIVAQNLAVLMVDLVVVARGIGTVVQDDVLPGSVGLAGIEELIAPRLAEVRIQSLLGTCRRTGPLADVARTPSVVFMDDVGDEPGPCSTGWFAGAGDDGT